MRETGVQLVLITGPAGVGKSTLAWEMSAQLAEAGTAHAVIESDELDRVFPRPTAADLAVLQPGTTDVSGLTLAALWSVYRKLGHDRAILSGVMLHLAFDTRWILAAIPDAELTVVRLQASDAALTARLSRRETDAGAAAQIARSLKQSARMAAQETGQMIVLATDGRTPADLAREVIGAIGW